MKENNFNQDSDNKNSTNEEGFEKMEENDSVDNTNRSQDRTLRKEETTEANDIITDVEKNDTSNQETLRAEEELVITERAQGTYNIFANLCGNSQVETVEEKNMVKILNDYFDSKELKEILKNTGVNKLDKKNVIAKLKDYLGRYDKKEIDLAKLKQKFTNYFSNFKSCNKEAIKKNKDICINIYRIEEEIASYIKEEENRNIGTFDNQTFGGDFNSPRHNENMDKSYLEIPQLDISAINSNEENQFAHTQHTNQSQTSNLVNSSNNHSNRSEPESNRGDTKIQKMPENEADHFNTTTIWSEQNNFINKFKIKILIEIYENTFVYKISPATENLIIDLVLETEKYIKSIMESVRKYQIDKAIKEKILEAIAKSTSKESVEKNINELEETGDFKIESLQKKDEEVKNSYLTKLLSKANKIYEKAYNKYQGYNNLSEKEIAEITEYAYRRLKETDKDKSERDNYNGNIKSKLSSGEVEDIKEIEAYVKSKGYTVESYDLIDFYEISQFLETQASHGEVIINQLNNCNDWQCTVDPYQINQPLETQPQHGENEVEIGTSNHCTDLYCYTTFAAAALLVAMQYMSSYDSEVLHHGFGPSGF